MNLDYARITKFVSWLLKEIIRLMDNGTLAELDELVVSVEKARHDYINACRRLKRRKSEG